MAKRFDKRRSDIVTESPHQSEPSGCDFSRKDDTWFASGEKLFKVVGVSFGLLCVLQAVLNISLRLDFFTKSTSECEMEATQLRRCLTNLTDEQEQHFQQGWIHFGSSFYYISTERKSWLESRRDCQNRGADLMIIDNQAEQNFIAAIFKDMWVGLTDDENESEWKWVDGTLLEETRFWCPGEPNHEGVENCGEVNFNNQACWNDKECGAHRFWICEKKIPFQVPHSFL